VVPKPDCSLSVVVIPWANAALVFGPVVNHLSDSDSEGVGEDAGEVGAQTDQNGLAGSVGHLSESPHEAHLVSDEVIHEEESEGLEEVSGKEREGVLEQPVWAFLEGDSSEGVKVRLVSSLQFLGEGSVGVVGFFGDFERNGDGGGQEGN